MAGISYWEGLLVDEIKEVRGVLEGVRKTKTAHVLSVVCIVERRFGNAFELKKSYREELESMQCSAKMRQQHAARLQELDQQLLALQINWDIMSQEEPSTRKGKDHHEDDADSTSTGWTAWTAWSAASATSAASAKTTKSSTSKSSKKQKKSKRKSSKKLSTINDNIGQNPW